MLATLRYLSWYTCGLTRSRIARRSGMRHTLGLHVGAAKRLNRRSPRAQRNDGVIAQQLASSIRSLNRYPRTLVAPRSRIASDTYSMEKTKVAKDLDGPWCYREAEAAQFDIENFSDRRFPGWEYGAANRTRTCDPVITNDVL